MDQCTSVHVELELQHMIDRPSDIFHPDRLGNLEALCRGLVRRVGALETENEALRSARSAEVVAAGGAVRAGTRVQVLVSGADEQKAPDSGGAADDGSATTKDVATAELTDVLNDAFDEATSSSYYAQVQLMLIDPALSGAGGSGGLGPGPAKQLAHCVGVAAMIFTTLVSLHSVKASDTHVLFFTPPVGCVRGGAVLFTVGSR